MKQFGISGECLDRRLDAEDELLGHSPPANQDQPEHLLPQLERAKAEIETERQRADLWQKRAEHLLQQVETLEKQDRTIDDAEKLRLTAMAESCAVSILQRLLANYDTDRNHIEDSDLDNEQSIAITFRGALGDIRNARKALQCFDALRGRRS